MKVDTHVHSTLSDGLSTVEEIAKAARARGLEAFFLTDHDKLYGYRELFGVKILPGEEVSTSRGHILALFIEEEIPPGLSPEETIERIHDASGIAIAAHPFDRLRKGLSDYLFRIIDALDAIEAFNGYEAFPGANKKALRVALEYKKPITAGTDAHKASHVGSCYMIVDELTPEALLRGEARCKKVSLIERLSVYLERNF